MEEVEADQKKIGEIFKLKFGELRPFFFVFLLYELTYLKKKLFKTL